MNNKKTGRWKPNFNLLDGILGIVSTVANVVNNEEVQSSPKPGTYLYELKKNIKGEKMWRKLDMQLQGNHQRMAKYDLEFLEEWKKWKR